MTIEEARHGHPLERGLAKRQPLGRVTMTTLNGGKKQAAGLGFEVRPTSLDPGKEVKHSFNTTWNQINQTNQTKR